MGRTLYRGRGEEGGGMWEAFARFRPEVTRRRHLVADFGRLHAGPHSVRLPWRQHHFVPPLGQDRVDSLLHPPPKFDPGAVVSGCGGKVDAAFLLRRRLKKPHLTFTPEGDRRGQNKNVVVWHDN